jgi:cell division septal protein FtsQ
MEQKNFFAPLKQNLEVELSEYIGKSIFDVPFDQIQNKLQETKWIQAVRLYRQWPNQLKVEIQSKELVFLLKSKHKEWIPVVSDGTLLNPVSQNSLPDIPIANQDIFEKNLLKI